MISVYVPAYNEQERLEGTIESLIKAAKEAGNFKLDIIIVNDASTDDTSGIIRKLENRYPNIRSIHHKQNKGIGIGFKEVLILAKYPQLMIIPGDNVVAFNLIKKLFENRNKADFILSFFLNKEIRTVRRNILSDVYGLIYMSTFRVYVQYLNSVCIYPTKILRSIQVHSTRFSMPAEITIKVLRTGCSYFEIPGYYLSDAMGKSTSFSFRNLIEVVSIYLFLIYEIYYKKRKQFNFRPLRIME